MIRIMILIILLSVSSCIQDKHKITKSSNDLKQIIDLNITNEVFDNREDFDKPESIPKKKKMAMQDEQEFLKFETIVLEDWKKAFIENDLELLKKHFTEDISITEIKKYTKTKSHEGIDEYVWDIGKPTKEINKVLGEYLAKFEKVQSLDLITKSLRSNSIEMRDEKNNEILSAQLDINYDLRALKKDNSRIHDRSQMIVNIININKKWVINGIEFRYGETLTAKNTFFEDATDRLGLDKLKVYPRREAIRRGGYALAVNDIDGDGELDLYIGNYEKSQVAYGKQGKDKQYFTIDNDKKFANDTLVKSVVFADFDNDGIKDLLTVRFDQATKDVYRQEDVRYYRGIGKGDFEKLEVLKNTNKENYAMPAAVADFNQDGFLDIYIGFPGAQDFTFFANQRFSNSAYDAQGLYLNDKNGKFIDKTKDLVTIKKRRNSENCCDLFPHSAQAIDYNLDGKSDLVVIDDAGGLSHFYQNLGDAKFSQVAGKVEAKLMDYGMSASLGDAFNTGSLDILFSSVNFHAASRMNKSYYLNYNSNNSNTEFNTYGFNGLKYYKGHKLPNNEIHYIDMTKVMGLDFPGEGLASAEFIDYNNDGLLDIYVTNGLWSGSNESKKNDISSVFIRSQSLNVETLMHLKSLGENHQDYNKQERSQSFFMDILTGFKGDVSTGEENESGESASLAGFQRNRLYRNNGDQTFTEIGFLAGVDSLRDGYIIATADLNRDGKMDLILRNSDPGFVDLNSRPVEVFMNNSSSNKSVILAFEGVESNRDSIGLIARAQVGDKELIRQVVSNNGSSQSEIILHFGLGKNEKIDKLDLLWPSGIKQKINNIPAGRHLIKEDKFNSKKLTTIK